jgi:sulfotransferase
MSPVNEFAFNIQDDIRKRVLRALFDAYYAELIGSKTVFDTNRAWCAFVPSIASLYPDSKVICCIRDPAWIIDSIERHAQATNMAPSRMFGFDPSGTVYSRVEMMMRPSAGVIGYPMSALRQAWFGEYADRLIAIRYESLTERPGEVMSELYKVLGEPQFQHDFDNLQYDEAEFDKHLGLPGFHRVRGRVEPSRRQPIVPPDIFLQNQHGFWEDPQANPRGVLIL